jgi:hypothetical protein
MKPVLNLAALELTLSGFLNEREMKLKEEDGYLSFDLVECDKGPRPTRPRICPYRFKRPTTIKETYDEVVQAGIIEDSPEERENFLWKYKHFATLPPPMLELERR